MKVFSELRSRLEARKPLRMSEPGLRETAVSVILVPGPAGPEVLLIRRAERAGDPWSGQMGLPGGGREQEDADLLATAIRETREEIGVLLDPRRLLGPLDDLSPRTPTLPPMLIRPFVFGLEERAAAKTSAEVAATYWVSLDALASSQGTSEVMIQGRPTSVPCFKIEALPEGSLIWGLTYRILSDMIRIMVENREHDRSQAKTRA
jgi:8-oxo-dGTP pyrophosphatase MutT (NUDIX family)